MRPHRPLSGKAAGHDAAILQHLLRHGEAVVALRIIGDRWSLLILRDVFLGTRRFEELRRLTGAARGTLTTRLNALVAIGILYRNPYQQSPVRHEYRLTDKGLSLYPAAMMLWSWETRWGGRHNLPPRLLHKACGKPSLPELVCCRCMARIDPREVEFAPGPGFGGRMAEPARYRRRQGLRAAADADSTLAHAIDIIGDQWAPLVLAAIMYRVNRYYDLQQVLGVATNILADRLRRMTRSGVLRRVRYQQRPPRYEYQLSAKGLDLCVFTAALSSWAEKWIAGTGGPVLRLRHTTCGQPLRTVLACSACHDILMPPDVSMGANRRWMAARRSIAAGRDSSRG
jgi:DNA-binding HxlR family transcriptional regulator